MIGFAWLMPLTLYANVALLPSVNVSVTAPTCVIVTAAGLHGFALNAAPVVR